MGSGGGGAGKPLEGIPEPALRSQEIQVRELDRADGVRAKPGDVRAMKSLTDHQNAGLDFDSEELVSIWFRHKSNSSALKEVSIAIKRSDAISREGLFT